MDILLIEDNDEDAARCESLILEIVPDAKISIFCNAEDALFYTNSHVIDALFIDRDLPGMNGYEFADNLRKMIFYHLVPIIFITGLVDDSILVREKYMNYEYIKKPYTREEFISKIEKCLLSLNSRDVSLKKAKSIIPKKKFSGKGHNIYIDVHDIVYAEIYGRFICIYTINQVYNNILMKMSDFLEYVEEPLIVQTHRSYAVNLKYVSCEKKKTRKIWELEMSVGGYKCPLSEVYRKKIRHILSSRLINMNSENV